MIKRHIKLDDDLCVLCHGESEFVLHLFKNCIEVQDFWRHGPLHFHARSHPATNITDWLIETLQKLNTDERDLFFMGFWAIWTERNNVNWKGTSFKPMNMIYWVYQSLSDFHSLHPKSVSKKKRPITKWQSPPRGRLKMNVDGAYEAESGKGGVDVVVRDENGRSIAVLAKFYQYVHSTLAMETEACRQGLLLGRRQGWTNMDIESDSSVLVVALNSVREDYSDVGRVVDDCKQYLIAMQSSTIRHIFREANSVADRLAHFACQGSIDSLWLEEPPDIIQDVLYEAMCSNANVARGMGLSPSLQTVPSFCANNTSRGA